MASLEIIFKKFNNLIVGARRGSPLAVGYTDKEKYIGSDSYALNSSLLFFLIKNVLNFRIYFIFLTIGCVKIACQNYRVL